MENCTLGDEVKISRHSNEENQNLQIFIFILCWDINNHLDETLFHSFDPSLLLARESKSKVSSFTAFSSRALHHRIAEAAKLLLSVMFHSSYKMMKWNPRISRSWALAQFPSSSSAGYQLKCTMSIKCSIGIHPIVFFSISWCFLYCISTCKLNDTMFDCFINRQMLPATTWDVNNVMSCVCMWNKLFREGASMPCQIDVKWDERRVKMKNEGIGLLDCNKILLSKSIRARMQNMSVNKSQTIYWIEEASISHFNWSIFK